MREQEGRPDLPGDFAMRLKLARIARRLAQKDLAAMVGVQPQTVWNWENERFVPTEDYRGKLSDIFGASLFASAEEPRRRGTPSTSASNDLRRSTRAVGVGGPHASETEQGLRATLPTQPELRPRLYEILADLSRLHPTDLHLDAAKKLLGSEAAVTLYSGYRSGSPKDAERAMTLLGEGVKRIIEGSVGDRRNSRRPA